MRTLICDKAPRNGKLYAVRYADLPELCPFCAKPCDEHRSFDPKRSDGNKMGTQKVDYRD